MPKSLAVQAQAALARLPTSNYDLGRARAFAAAKNMQKANRDVMESVHSVVPTMPLARYRHSNVTECRDRTPLPAALVSCERCTTGLSLMAIDLSGKLLSLLKDAVPNLSRVALLFDRTNPFKQRTIKSFGGAAQALGVSLSSAEISKPDDIEPVFDKIAQEHADGVVIPNGSSMVFNERARIGAALIAHRLPALGQSAESAPHGLLMSYGQDFPDFFRRAATYTDKILKGTKPADLPVEQPTKFKLVLNLRTANAFGVGFPQSLILSADEMIGA